MKTVQVTLLEDFGPVDRNLIRQGLLSEHGITGVFDGPGEHSLTVEYDPAAVGGERLIEVLCSNGVSPQVIAPPEGPTAGEHWLETLRDGRRVLIRPIRPSDVGRNARFIQKLSEHGKHFAFLGGMEPLSEIALRYLCEPDYAHEMAYIALGLEARTGEAPDQVGVCRYTGADPAKGAEILVAVADAWRRQGLGGILLGRLIDYARAHRVPRLYSIDTTDNERMRRLALTAGFDEERNPSDRRQVIYSLDLRRPGPP